MDFEITDTTVVSAEPGVVFGLITDIARLPDWNHEIREIHEKPAELTPGAEWVVEIHAMGTHWPSRSTVVAADRQAGLFAYRSVSDDGNPSYGEWLWEVAPHPEGSQVRVHVSVHPATFWRRHLLSNIRSRSLKRAVRRSLTALQDAVVRTPRTNERKSA